MRNLKRSLTVIALTFGVAGGANAAVDAGTLSAKPGIDLSAPGADYQLDVEMIVRGWVLCASATSAEKIVSARQRGAAAARQAYAALAAAKSCGSFAQLKVILQKPVYASATDAGYDARIFGGLVDFSGSWAAGYLVSGGLAE
jgi:hypothetical protein